MPPTSPPMNALPFQIASLTGQAEALARRLLDDDVGVRLEGVDLDRADVVEVVEDVDVRVAAAWAIVALKKSQPSGSSEAIEPTSASCTSGIVSLTIR
jgi:hypothetical protein